MLKLLSAGPMCAGCQIVKKALERARVAFVEQDIRLLTESEIAGVVTDLRLCGWNEKLVYSTDGKPILQAPIVQNATGALWASFLLPDGQTLRKEFTDSFRVRNHRKTFERKTKIPKIPTSLL